MKTISKNRNKCGTRNLRNNSHKPHPKSVNILGIILRVYQELDYVALNGIQQLKNELVGPHLGTIPEFPGGPE
jgi:hypothetical protein